MDIAEVEIGPGEFFRRGRIFLYGGLKFSLLFIGHAKVQMFFGGERVLQNAFTSLALL